MKAFGTAVLLALAAMGTWAASAGEAPSAAGSLAGRLLVATTEMPDPRFMRTVVYMVRHDASGAMGLVINRPMGEVPLARLLDELGLERGEVSRSIRLHYGGPVDRVRGFVLHTIDYLGKSTLRISESMALTWQPEIWRAMASGTGPRRSLFALGYSGWGPGQLEAEIGGGHWVAVPADEALVFDDDYDAKWPRAMARRTINL